ncbi:MAG: SPOR domain-containing protein [Sphingomonadaceae bacterium]
MTDARAEEGEDLPWLEAVEEEDEDRVPSVFKMVGAVVLGLIAIGLVVGGLFWLVDDDGDVAGEAEVIAAPEGDYKVKPDDPGGMEVEGEGEASYAASEGEAPKGKIDTAAVPEQPVTARPQQPAQAQPKQPQPKQEAQPPAPAAASGPTIQLGAFSSQAAAQNAWKALSGRFSYLAPLGHMVTKVPGRDLYRLRASGENADDICARLRVAGETCVEVD